MAGIKNIIRKQTVHFHYNGPVDGFALQKEVSDWCTHTLIPQLEQQLEPYCSPHWHMVLNKLELSATIDGNNWQEQIQQQVMSALQAELAQQHIDGIMATDRLATHIAANPAVEHPLQQAFDQSWPSLQQTDAATVTPHIPKPAGHTAAKAKSNQSLHTENGVAPNEGLAKKQTSLVLFFLQHGYLPWWSDTILAIPFVQWLPQWLLGQLPLDAAQPHGAQARVQQLVQQLKMQASERATERLAQQLSGEQWTSFVQLAFPEALAEWGHFQQLLAAFSTLIGNRNQHRAVIAQAQQAWLAEKLEIVTTPSTPAWAEPLYQAILAGHRNKKANDTYKATVLADPTASLIGNPLAQQWQQWILQKQQQANSPDNIPPTTLTTKTVAALRNQTSQQPNEQPSTPTVGKKPVAKQTDKPTAPKLQSLAVQAEWLEGIFIENAGAVIVAPFLPALFKSLGWAKNGILLKPAKAAWLIQYMVTGSIAIGEADLVLPKILCGLEPDVVINPWQKITAQQKKEVQELLQSVVAHWSILKNTSPEGLQQSFLQRNGKLILTNDQWLLQVEQKSYDMLLQQLPWNINMIRLPWMKNMLRTEWV